MDILKRSHRIQAKLLQRIAGGQWVRYEGFGVSVRVLAVVAQTSPTQIGGGGEVTVGKKWVDWLVVKDEFVTDDGQPIVPAEGARITPESGEGVYEVVAGPSGMCFTDSDGREVRLRIHTDKYSDDA